MARYDKYDPINGGFRAAVAVDFPDGDLGAAWGYGINSAGQCVKGAGQTGVIGVLVVTQKPGRVGPQREITTVDIMQVGCITDFGPSTYGNVPGVNFGNAGTNYYSDANGFISASQTDLSVQTVTVGAASAGTFTLTYGGQTTTAIAYNASAATVQAALVALSSIGAGNAVVTSPSAGIWVISLSNALEESVALGAFTGAGSGLTGGAFAVSSSKGVLVGFTVETDRLQVTMS
jgi:hypothetical protein